MHLSSLEIISVENSLRSTSEDDGNTNESRLALYDQNK